MTIISHVWVWVCASVYFAECDSMDSPHQQSVEITHRGWLKKLGGTFKTWKRRYFVLSGSHLTYYTNSEETSRPLGKFCIEATHIDVPGPKDPDYGGEGRGFVFIIRPTNPNEPLALNHGQFVLAASTAEERQTWIRTIRRVLYLKKGGSLFGTSLSEVALYTRPEEDYLPRVVYETTQFIRANGSQTEGIFRKCGSQNIMHELVDLYDTAAPGPILRPDVHTVHQAAGLLKLYLRELPEPLVPFHLYDSLNALTIAGSDLDGLSQLLRTIPDPNYHLLGFVCRFLNEIAEHRDKNRMTVENLASMFAPNLFRQQSGDLNEAMITSPFVISTVSEFIRNHEQLFPEDTPSTPNDDGLFGSTRQRPPHTRYQPDAGNAMETGFHQEVIRDAFRERNGSPNCMTTSTNSDQWITPQIQQAVRADPSRSMEPPQIVRNFTPPNQPAVIPSGDNAIPWNKRNGYPYTGTRRRVTTDQIPRIDHPSLTPTPCTTPYNQPADHPYQYYPQPDSLGSAEKTMLTPNPFTKTPNQTPLMAEWLNRTDSPNWQSSSWPLVDYDNSQYDNTFPQPMYRNNNTPTPDRQLYTRLPLVNARGQPHVYQEPYRSMAYPSTYTPPSQLTKLPRHYESMDSANMSWRAPYVRPTHRPTPPPFSSPDLFMPNGYQTLPSYAEQQPTYNSHRPLSNYHLSSTEPRRIRGSQSAFLSQRTESATPPGQNSQRHRAPWLPNSQSSSHCETPLSTVSVDNMHPEDQARYWRALAISARADAAGQRSRAHSLAEELNRIRCDLGMAKLEIDLLRQKVDRPNQRTASPIGTALSERVSQRGRPRLSRAATQMNRPV